MAEAAQDGLRLLSLGTSHHLRTRVLKSNSESKRRRGWHSGSIFAPHSPRNHDSDPVSGQLADHTIPMDVFRHNWWNKYWRVSTPPTLGTTRPFLTRLRLNRLIAIMLGRLRMSVDQAIQCYTMLAERIFSETKHKWQDGRFKSSNLERVIKRMVQDHTERQDEDSRMLDTRPDGHNCRV